MKREHVVIVGCGYVGCALANALLAQGSYEVTGLRRDISQLPEGVHGMVADLRDPAGVPIPEDVDVLVYTAAADGFSQEEYRAVYVDGVRHMLQATQRAGATPRLVLFTSSTGVYAQTDGSWVDESSPAASRFFTGRMMLEGEELILESPWRASVVRLGGIYGPGRTRMIDQVRAGAAVIPSSTCYTNRVHRDDCAGILAHLIARDPASPLAPIYLGVDNDPADRGEVVRWLADTLDAPTPAVATDDAEDSAHRPRGCKRCRNTRLLETGYSFRFPTYREGYSALLAGLVPTP